MWVVYALSKLEIARENIASIAQINMSLRLELLVIPLHEPPQVV